MHPAFFHILLMQSGLWLFGAAGRSLKPYHPYIFPRILQYALIELPNLFVIRAVQCHPMPYPALPVPEVNI